MTTDAVIEALSLVRRAKAAGLSTPDIYKGVGVGAMTYYRWLERGIKKLEHHRRLQALVENAERALLTADHAAPSKEGAAILRALNRLRLRKEAAE